MTDLLLTNSSFSLHKMLTVAWSGVDYLWVIVMFLSAVWTLILTAPIHYSGSAGEKRCKAKFLQICSDEEINSSTSWRVSYKHIYIFWWTILLM